MRVAQLLPLMLLLFIMTETDGSFRSFPLSTSVISVPFWRFLETSNGQFGKQEETVVSLSVFEKPLNELYSQ